MLNQLANESSPYLLQHASNPVNWYAWGPEALELAQSEDKPIFLSIGYSACHWCHVMEHESFENDAIAGTLNDHFVSIKVDREERPDLDQIYMNVVQMISGRGGWPMSVFLTPEGKPFFGGTYWPPSERMGMPGFDQVLSSIIDAWNARREQADEQAELLVKRLGEVGMIAGSGEEATLELLWDAAAELQRSADRVQGGFGNAPKFPHSMALQLLMRVVHRRPSDDLLELVKLNLDRMAHGGIYDHLAGGFARYSVDTDWLVPHFEKMLYDNALLSDAYLDGFLLTGESEYARVVTETLDYQLNYMTDAEGGFHSTEDADSEGVEGKFYVWTPAEIQEVLGDEAGERFCFVYDVSEQGNFEGSSILNLPRTIGQSASELGWDQAELRVELAQSRARLLEVRDRRIRPGKDDKVLASWNGLMIHTMARAAGILDDEKYLQAAASAARFVLEKMCRQDGRLLHSWRAGEAKIDGFLDDYANMANALVTLYESSFEEYWIDQAVRLGGILMEQFHDPEDGGFFYTANDHETLIARNKEIFDNATPSSSAMVGMALLRLGKLCGNTVFQEAAWDVLRQGTGVMQRSAIGGAQLLNVLDMKLGPTPEIVILGDRENTETAGLLQDLRQCFLPNRVVACTASADDVQSVNLKEVFAGKHQQDENVTTFICENFTCQQPVMGRQAFRETLDTMSEGEPVMAEGDVSITAEPVSDASCRFTVSEDIYPNQSFAFMDKEAAAGSSLAERLFDIEGVSRVVVSHNQLTVNKTADVDWQVIGRTVGEAIREHLASGEPAVSDAARESLPSTDEIREGVQDVIDKDINPSVASHGGVINLINVQDNTVYIQMGGGCQGCGQADVTLKFGIENAIRAAVPGVGDILDVTDHAAGRNPYYTPSKK